MNKKGLIVGAVVGLGALLFASGAKAQEGEPEPEPGPEPEPEPKPEPKPKPKPKPPPSGEDPPNTSGDKAGYNTQMFPASSASAVRQWLINLGYSVLLNEVPLVKNAKVKTFQRDYNAVSKSFENMGTLAVDGTAGKNTLNAIEIANSMISVLKMSWQNIVKKYK